MAQRQKPRPQLFDSPKQLLRFRVFIAPVTVLIYDPKYGITPPKVLLVLCRHSMQNHTESITRPECCRALVYGCLLRKPLVLLGQSIYTFT